MLARGYARGQKQALYVRGDKTRAGGDVFGEEPRRKPGAHLVAKQLISRRLALAPAQKHNIISGAPAAYRINESIGSRITALSGCACGTAGAAGRGESATGELSSIGIIAST